METIWRKEGTLEILARLSENTLVDHLNIVFTEIGPDYLRAEMEVKSIVHQPMGLLHGGASVALAETVGSMAANLVVDETRYCVGLEINANHVRPITHGVVTATAKPLALGRSIQVWEVRIENESAKLICISRLTMAVKKGGINPHDKAEKEP